MIEILPGGREEDFSVSSVMSFLDQMMCKIQLFLSVIKAHTFPVPL